MNIGGDLRHAIRRLINARGFTTVTVLTIAFGMAALVIDFGLINALLFQPKGLVEPAATFNLYDLSRSRHQWTERDFAELAAWRGPFTSLVPSSRFVKILRSSSQASYGLGEAVGEEYFRLTASTPALGRFFVSNDFEASAPLVAVISYSLWVRLFGQSDTVLDSQLEMDATTFQIIGVADEAFRGLDMPSISPTAVWVPLSRARILVNAPEDAGEPWLNVRGVLRPEVGSADAAQQLRVFARRLDDLQPIRNRPRQFELVRTDSVRTHESLESLARALAFVGGGVALLLLVVTSANLAALFAIRNARRQQELDVRRQLGASRRRLLLQLGLEPVIVMVSGMILGLALSWILGRLFVITVFVPGLKIDMAPMVDGKVLLSVLFASALGMGIGTANPVRKAWRTVVFQSPPRYSSSRIIITSHVAVASLGVVVSICLLPSAKNWLSRSAAIDSPDLVFGEIDFSQNGYQPSVAASTIQSIMALLEGEPGFVATMAATALPSGASASRGRLARGSVGGDYQDGLAISVVGVKGNYPEMFGFHVDQGRWLRDSADGLVEVVISDATVRRSSLGMNDLYLLSSQSGQFDRTPVVIVGSIRDGAMAATRDRGVVYVPLSDALENRVLIGARVAMDSARAITALYRVVRQVDERLVFMDVRTGQQIADQDQLPLRWILGVLAGICFLALGLTCVGVYAVSSEFVGARLREWGIRLSLGATPLLVARHVIVRLVPAVVGGTVLGSIVSVWVIEALATLPPLVDASVAWWTPLVALAVIGGFAFMACLGPAHRAAFTTPSQVLRSF